MFTLGDVFNSPPPPLVIIIPIVIFLAIYVRMVIAVIDDLYKPERLVAGGNKDLWAVIIVLFSIPGIFAYYSMGRLN